MFTRGGRRLRGRTGNVGELGEPSICKASAMASASVMASGEGGGGGSLVQEVVLVLSVCKASVLCWGLVSVTGFVSVLSICEASALCCGLGMVVGSGMVVGRAERLFSIC
jgi:hypothetical protein